MGIRLFIGGHAQGKLQYVLQKYRLPEEMVWDGNKMQQEMPGGDAIIINHFHDWAKRRMAEGGNPEEEMLFFPAHYRNCIIICDEIGNGIVPENKLEREYRERLGRMLVELAAKAETVERILCGIGQKIK